MTAVRPRATYRLQFRNGMTFDAAAGVVPYLARLGVSHLYASPIFTAVAGSTHGYDVADTNAIEPALGGRAGFKRFAAALKAHGLGLVLDFVPNHMGAAPDNPWWADVLAWGRDSRFADHFDIDWDAPKLILPTLGEPYGAALREGKLAFGYDAAKGMAVLRYFEHAFPLAPPTTAPLFEALGGRIAEAGAVYAASTPDTIGRGREALAAIAGDGGASLDRALAGLSAQTALVHRIHEAQVWRLAHFRLGREEASYRRFFEVTGLVGLAVERPAVFDDAHRLLLELAAEGAVDGVRIDHVDGLADPKGYMRRLREALPEGAWLVVEKILEPPEELGPDWPADGTSGYETITAFGHLFCDPLHAAALDAAYADFLGRPVSFEAELEGAKRDIVDYNLAAEVDRLADMVHAVAIADPDTRDIGRDSLRRALVEMLAGFPVYRTYVSQRGVSDADRRLVARAADVARAARHPEDPAAADLLERLVLLDVEAEARAEALAIATRFQQTTVPVAAKAVEDTLFYRFNRLIGLNEVGGDPSVLGGTIAHFHAETTRRQETQPFGLTTTATHDTKRGEDARARLYALSEAPSEWYAAVARWHAINAGARVELPDGPAPEPAVEWMLYQALFAAWPAAAAGLGQAEDPWERLCERFLGYVEKALREAKLRTSWTMPNAAYESAVKGFAEHLCDPEAREFRTDFVAASAPFWMAGALTGLSQTLLKLAMPGVPDVYQGTEGWDLAMVDPDNRRPVAFDRLEAALDAVRAASPDDLLADWRSGRIKMRVLAAGLEARRRDPELFADGAYRPLTVTGRQADRLVAFARIGERSAALVAVPRLALPLVRDADAPRVDPADWEDTAVEWPRALAGRTLGSAFGDGATVAAAAGEMVPAAELLGRWPVALHVTAG